MKYRKLGNTGLSVSEIGMGCEGFVDNEGKFIKVLLDTAHDNGLNYFDLYQPNPETHKKIGETLKGRRRDFIIQSHVCSVWENNQYLRTRDINKVRPAFEKQLRNLGTDYLDVGMIHYVDDMKDWEIVKSGPIMAYVQALKQKGTIKAVGISNHNPIVGLAAVRSGLIDVLMFSINPCYDLQPPSENVEDIWADESYSSQLVNMNPLREQLYAECQASGVGITVMKAFGGGDLLDATLSPAGKALTPAQCINYCLTRPAVSTVLVGAHTVEQLKTSLAYENATEKERDYATAFASFPKISWEGHCMYCGHCAPCPKGIDVANVTKFLNLCRAQKMVPETVREHYAVLKHHASECIACGACEKRCPFKVPVIANMKDATETFGK